MIHHFHETDHKVSEGTQRGIDAALATFRDLGAELREVQLSPLQDWAACGSLISMTERAAAYEEWSRGRGGEDRRGAGDLFDRPNFTMPFNVAGYPAISVCAGFGDGGLPVAIQLVGKPFREPTLFRIADPFEKTIPCRGQRPALIAA